MSKTVQKYLRELGIKSYSTRYKSYENYKNRENIFEKLVVPLKVQLTTKYPPYVIGFHFVRGTKHKFDFNNATQIICDLLVAHGVIEDDNMDILIPWPWIKDKKWYSYDKENPGCWLEV